MISVFNELAKTTRNFDVYHQNTIPLCAAENIMSDFCKIPLSAGFQERYIMGSAYAYDTDGNFVGSENLLPFYKMLDRQCGKLFQAQFSDVRTLTGMNCLTMVLMSLSRPGDKIMILGSNYGGHASVKGIGERLSLEVFEAPYILENYDFDYEKVNKIIHEKNIKFFLPAPSDILFSHDLTRITDDKVIILNDASQLLGLIGGGIMKNPLVKMPNMIMFGGTHKTLPGPAHGIALTNNEDLFKVLDSGINPKYLRNTQMHQVISLLFCLVEAEYFGSAYQANIVKTSNVLAGYLAELGFTIPQKGGVYSETHQIFIECTQSQMETIYANAIDCGITLNTKKKPLFHGGCGIRLGTQEIARYNWDDASLRKIAEIIHLISFEKVDKVKVSELKKQMPPKNIGYTFDKEQTEELLEYFAN